MTSTTLLHELLANSAWRFPDRRALTSGASSTTYQLLHAKTEAFSWGLISLGLNRGERVAIYLEKRLEAVVASFGAPMAGGVFVPVNPLLKPEQVGYILRDCNVRILVTSSERLSLLRVALRECVDLRHVIVVGDPAPDAAMRSASCVGWDAMLGMSAQRTHRMIDTDMAAILYTSGSTGKPKGVVLSHRNMVAGAISVASYLENRPEDTLLAALPLSFDAGFSQLTTAFYAGARVVLLNYLMPRDVIVALSKERVTGLTAVPPLWIQLTQVSWPEDTTTHLRYIANTGGRMPLDTLTTLRGMLPQTKCFLMYGLTEAFRSTYLPPDEIDRRPDSIGKAIPNAEILVLREDGSPCAPDEPGELVHRGALVGLGYWNDPEKTAERYRPLPARETGLVLPEIAVFSGDTVRMDEEGFLYFIGRRDEMIKTSGYRVSPVEVEEVLYTIECVGEVAAFGVPHPVLGQAIVAVIAAKPDTRVDPDRTLEECRQRLPAYMIPSHLEVRGSSLPRNPNGKIDRKVLASEFQELFQESHP